MVSIGSAGRTPRASVEIHAEGLALSIVVSDDGLGGADPAHGTGLTGLLYRVERARAPWLTAVRGIGPWSAQMFLLHHYRRPDIFPDADGGLLRSAQLAFALPARLTPNEPHTRAEPWRPLRSYAAALLWAHGQTLAKR